MNFVFISPQFPTSYWHFCDSLRQLGVNVLGIGDAPYDDIPGELKGALTEYYWVASLEDYDQVYRAFAYLAFKHGRIDWVESNNEHWLTLDARLRDDFNISTGPSLDQVLSWQSKAEMKPLYAAAGVPSARSARVTDLDGALEFAGNTGYPLFVKPERGVGSGGTAKLEDEAQLRAFFADKAGESHVIEEYVVGDICSYDAILDSRGEPLFENQEEFPPSMADVVEQRLDMSYLSRPKVDPKLAKLGRAAAKSFGLASRFVHMEFFRLSEAKEGLGKKGDYVGLEVNVRPPGGLTPDMMNYAHSTDVYRIWAEMVVFDRRELPEGDSDAYCVYVGRRDGVEYVHDHGEIVGRYLDKLVACERVADALSDDLGNQCYVVRLGSPSAVRAFKRFAMMRK